MPKSDENKDLHRVGRDEMNLAEFPITLLTERAPRGIKTMVFEDQYGKLTVSGSDAYGLPTAPDSDVIVALLHMTKLRNDFTDSTVEFTRYELLRLLGWPDKGRHYQRLSESLHRWVGVTLHYDGCWWDNAVKCRVDASFHIIDRVTIYDQEAHQTLRARRQPRPRSSFTWGKDFFESCRANNLKQLDLDTYFALKSAVSKQLYRFLDKRFYLRGDWTFDLRELAHERVGLCRSYAARNLKQKLQPVLEELEGIGFLEPLSLVDRYSKAGRGAWTIRLVRKRKRPAPAAAPPAEVALEPEPTGLERELVERGVTRCMAAALVRDFPEDRIKAQIANLDGRRRKVKDPGAWLASAIRTLFAVPAGSPPARALPAATDCRRCTDTALSREEPPTAEEVAQWREWMKRPPSDFNHKNAKMCLARHGLS